MSDDPTICVASLFRNSSERGELDRYDKQWHEMDWDKEKLHFVAIEGDSTDNTFERLHEEADRRQMLNEEWFTQRRMTLIKKDQGTPYYGSNVIPDRLEKLSELGNLALDAYDGEDYFLWIESDLLWERDLLRRFMWLPKADVQAPLVLSNGNTRRFYDVWAFRIGIMQINPVPANYGPGCFAWDVPYHPSFDPVKPFQLDSAGSCLFISKRVMETRPRFGLPEAIVTLCHDIRGKGFEIWCNPRVEIRHPVV